jgi:hypothetical protein
MKQEVYICITGFLGAEDVIDRSLKVHRSPAADPCYFPPIPADRCGTRRSTIDGRSSARRWRWTKSVVVGHDRNVFRLCLSD